VKVAAGLAATPIYFKSGGALMKTNGIKVSFGAPNQAKIGAES